MVVERKLVEELYHVQGTVLFLEVEIQMTVALRKMIVLKIETEVFQEVILHEIELPRLKEALVVEVQHKDRKRLEARQEKRLQLQKDQIRRLVVSLRIVQKRLAMEIDL